MERRARFVADAKSPITRQAYPSLIVQIFQKLENGRRFARIERVANSCDQRY